MAPKEAEKEEAIISDIFFKRNRIISTKEFKTYKAILFEEATKAKGAPILAAFPNIGITPVLTVAFLIEDFDLPLIGVVICNEVPPVCVINSKGQPSTAIRIYGNEKIIVICSEMKAEGNMKHLVQVILQVIEELDSRMLWCVEGVGVQKVDKIEREEMQYLTTNEALAKDLQSMGHKPFHDAMLAGITGGLLAETALTNLNYDATCLLVPTSSLYPDALSSVLAIRLLAKIHDWNSDPAKLEESAKNLEGKVQELLGSSLKRSGSSWSSMYQ